MQVIEERGGGTPLLPSPSSAREEGARVLKQIHVCASKTERATS